MIAFDTDILTLILRGDPTIVGRLASLPPEEQTVPVVVLEEMMRGRLNSIRLADTGKGKLSLTQAYAKFREMLADIRAWTILEFSPAADALVRVWRLQKIRVGVSDLRIAACCIASGARLISRNQRDFQQIPGLNVEFW